MLLLKSFCPTLACTIPLAGLGPRILDISSVHLTTQLKELLRTRVCYDREECGYPRVESKITTLVTSHQTQNPNKCPCSVRHNKGPRATSRPSEGEGQCAARPKEKPVCCQMQQISAYSCCVQMAFLM